MKKPRIGLFIFLFLLLTKTVFSKVNLSDSLTAAFGRGCQSQGDHMRRALDNNANLKKIIQSIQKDTGCLDWANSLDGILQQGDR